MEERKIAHSRAARFSAAETHTLSNTTYKLNAMVPVTMA